jgi:hypothetical protein
MLKLVKYHPLFAYSVGDEFEVGESDTKILIEGGYAVEISKKTQKETETEKKGAEPAIVETAEAKVPSENAMAPSGKPGKGK